MMSIQKFLSMLEEPAVQEKIRAIAQGASQPAPNAGAAGQTPQPKMGEPWGQTAAAEAELAQTRQRLEAAERDLAQTQQQLVANNGEYTKTRQRLAEAEHELTRTKQQLAADNEELAKTRQRLTEAAQKCRETQQKLEQAQRQAEGMQNRIDSLEGLLCQKEDAVSRKDAECAALQSQLRTAGAEREKLRDGLALRERELAQAKQALCAEQERAQRHARNAESLQQQLKPFDELVERYQAFCTLSEGRRADLGSIVPCGDPAAFLTAGSQRDAAFGLWDYMKTRLEELSDAERDTLTRTLLYFLKQYNSLWKQPIYEWMDGEAGKAFDDQRHSRSSRCSRYQGNIQTVLLPGIWNRNKNSPERKCIVQY